MRVFLLHFLFISLSCFAQSGNEIEKVKRRIPGVAGFSSDYVNHQAPKTRGGLPSSFSLKKFVPPVGDQGDKGTCVGWATTYAGMTILNNIDLNRNGASLSINECMSPQMTYDICKIRVDDTCENGIYIKAALNTLVNFGTTTLAKYPYRCAIFDDEKQGVKRVINDSADADEIKDFLSSIRKVRLKGFMSIGGANIIANVKYYLSQNMPVIIGAEMYNSIQSNSVAGVWTGIMDSYPGGHAMCVVGYDDTKEGGAFEILNSWGEDWSSNGYIWFRYADFAKVVDEAYALLGVLREDSASIHNFNFTISANGKKTASILEIVTDENYMTSTDLKIGGFAKGLKIKYPESETEYSLAIKSNMEEGFYAYAFGICCGGQVSLLSPINGANNYYEGLNSGLIIPSDQLTGIKLSQSYYDGDEICVLLSKKKIDQQQIQNSLVNSYSSLSNYINLNYLNRVSLNEPEIIEYSNGKVKIKNMYEVNDIQPLFFEYQMLDKEKAKEEKLEEVFQPLFFSVDMDSKQYLSTYVFTNYFLTSSEKQYALKIKVRKNWFRLGIGSKVNIAIESEDSKKIVRTFHCASKQVLDKIRGEVFSLLIYYRVNFTVTY